MKTRAVLALAGVACVTLANSPSVQAGDGISAYNLADHKTSVAYGSTVTMWDCWGRDSVPWDDGIVPKLSAWDGSRWVLWDVSSVSVDNAKCEKGDRKVVFTLQVDLKGRPTSGQSYNLVRVKEHCAGCETARWTLPVTVR